MEKFSTKYYQYFKIGFKKSIEYKSYLLGIVISPIIIGLFFYFIWSYIYQIKSGGDPNYLIGGFIFSEMIVYLIIGILIQTVKGSNVSENISNVIKTGNIVTFLCRPVNFVKSLLSENIGYKVIPFIGFSILLVIVTNILKVGFPEFSILVLFIIYGILLVFFQILIDILIGGMAFWFTEIGGIRSSINQILWILSGRVLPLSLFPVIMQQFLRWTPFFYLEYTFASIFLGKLGFEEILRAMGIFILWIFITILFIRFLYYRGFRKLETLGG